MTPNDADTRTKVAVLGGGVGALTAACELTATEELRKRFDVTVYQLGWRLGGKGASGRNAAVGDRIEEHGLHIWFGFYVNAFRLMREVYEEADRAPGTPLSTLDEAFKGFEDIVLYDKDAAGWHAFDLNWSRNGGHPSDPGGDALPTFWDIAPLVTHWALHRWRYLIGERRDLQLAGTNRGFIPSFFHELTGVLGAGVDVAEATGGEALLRAADQVASRGAGEMLEFSNALLPHGLEPATLLARLLTGFRDWLWEKVVKDRCDTDYTLRLYFTIFDTIASATAGIVGEKVLEDGFDAINDYEWCEWLEKYGAKEVTLGADPAQRSPLLRAVYDVAFGYPEGDISKANLAAGTATLDLVRLVGTYRGHIMYKMQAGMGDTVFAPIYEVLKKRKVKFRFFHEVTGLRLSADKKLVEKIEYVPQVELNVDEYEPLVPVKDAVTDEDLPCWPSEPRWEQLVKGDKHKQQRLDFERTSNPLGAATKTLKLGDDFDAVVLGIPVGALKPICTELIEHDAKFESMITNSATVETQAFQLWLNKTKLEVGWGYPDSVAGCYVEPLDTYCDMTHLIPRETWTAADDVQSIAYFCGVLKEGPAGETPEEADKRAEASALDFLDNDIEPLWPRGVSGPGGPLDYDLLVDRQNGVGKARFQAQYCRANITPSERYVLTPAGSVKHRLRADESGFDNLVLAGDWTRTGVDGGCVEAAVISGMQAARGLIGGPHPPIVGADTNWLGG